MGMAYMVAAYAVFVGFTVIYVVALIAQHKRAQAELDEARATGGSVREY